MLSSCPVCGKMCRPGNCTPKFEEEQRQRRDAYVAGRSGDRTSNLAPNSDAYMAFLRGKRDREESNGPGVVGKDW